MSAPAAPSTEARAFGLDEMFFSTTDRKGVIRSGNAVFARVSAYTHAELLGRPHNLIRHPDMPRAVFRLLWRRLHEGRPIAAYVKNRAKDHRHYWVLALITPLAEGYLSIRFKPSSPLLARVEALYAEMVQLEQDAASDKTQRNGGMDAAEERMLAALRQEGFADYDHFMWALVHTEMTSRETGLRAMRPAHRAPPERSVDPDPALTAVQRAAEEARAAVQRFYSRLDELTGFSRELAEKSTFVAQLTRDIRFVALGTSIKATRLGEQGGTLGIIAHYLGEAATRTTGDVQRLAARISDISEELEVVVFNLAGARLQIEMVVEFCLELLHGDRGAAVSEFVRAPMIRDLEYAFGDTTRRATEPLPQLGQHLHQLNAEAEDLGKTMLTLQVAQICGRVETNRIQADESVGTVFEEIRRQVEDTAKQLHDLEGITQRFSRFIADTPAIEREIGAAVRRLQIAVAGLRDLNAPVLAPRVLVSPRAPAPPSTATRPGALWPDKRPAPSPRQAS